MELQINKFWILKGQSTINSANEYEPDVLNTFCATRVWKLKILQRMYELILPPINFAVFERQYLLEYYAQRANYFTMY